MTRPSARLLATLAELTERAQRRVQRQQGHAAHRRNRGVVTRPSDKRLVALTSHVILLARIVVGAHAPENQPVTRLHSYGRDYDRPGTETAVAASRAASRHDDPDTAGTVEVTPGPAPPSLDGKK